MPYAANGMIAQDRFPGAIEITEEQYSKAIQGMYDGLVVTIDGGFNVLVPKVDVPPPTPSPAPTPEEVRMFAVAERDRLLSLAALRMAPLQDAVDLETATPAEIASLKQWKRYRVDLNRVEQQPDFPTTVAWPEVPGNVKPA